ncbi:bifunctional nuclease family protein [Opitutaceae bacterium TAV4]|uniref:bifunctional nuclease family protein n=1 Tax=Geminisphaera colitermitum TaxID=1148786 RepID=UPI00030755A4|nr:bifunctional nuclease family protein [Geminisphaera colitermitum]RRJ97630.1 bifunctional nuclease family protein [Opitutaceae bacterium TAV4]RRK02049.1 bifunctional nuclease family protein [Opitutaceae bacterium TAV3]
MQKDVLPIVIKGVMPTANGCAIFLGNDDKTFVIYVDHFVGNALQVTLEGVKRDRPLTHDLIGHILTGLGAKLARVIINDVSEGTFFARLLLVMENELGKKIVEIDARPSDATVLAIQQQLPLLVTRKVFDSVEDMTEVLERVRAQQAAAAAASEDSDDDADSTDTDDDDEGDDADDNDEPGKS